MINISSTETPWVTLGPGDVSFQLTSEFVVTNRAGIRISRQCPEKYANVIAVALEQGWVEPVAVVPKTDPTLMWDLLKSV